jgi:hypothetical protein
MNPVAGQVEALDTRLFEGIESQTTDDERRSLLAVQRATVSRHNPYVYLEIGSHLGGSIQPHALDARCVRIYSIDPRPHQQPDDREAGFIYTYENNSTARMLELLRGIPGADVAKIRCFDADAAQVDARAIDSAPHLAFIDGEHTKRAVLSDFEACSRVIRPDATVLFHDYGIIAPAVDQIRAELERAGRTFLGVRLDGSVYALFMEPSVALADPHLSALVRQQERAARRRRIIDFARRVTPDPLWRLLRFLKTGRW